MAGLRQIIASAILRILSDGRPRKARDLTPLVQMQLQGSEIEKSDINSVLYRDLATIVKSNAAFEWQLATKNQETPGQQPGSKQEPDNSADLLRTLQRLRSGLPPCEHVESLTVAGVKIVSKLRTILAAQSHTPSWAVVRGDYGAGKSHALALYTDLALREGYAVCHLSADGLNNALNHPQRFMSSLFSTMELPARPTYGYTDVLHDLLTYPDLATRTREIAALHLDGWSSVALESRVFLNEISKSLASADNHSDLWRDSVRIVSSHLNGDSIRHLTASPSTRQMAYNLLMVARDLVLELGLKGIALGIDEVESIYTKLPTSRSRAGAIRTLSALCNLANVKVLLAVTPDAHRRLREDIPTMLRDNLPCLDVEDMLKWFTVLLDGTVPVLDCRQLGSSDREELLAQIGQLYGSVHGSDLTDTRFADSWSRVVERGRNTTVPTRILVRQAIDHLDGFRYQQVRAPTHS